MDSLHLYIMALIVQRELYEECLCKHLKLYRAMFLIKIETMENIADN